MSLRPVEDPKCCGMSPEQTLSLFPFQGTALSSFLLTIANTPTQKKNISGRSLPSSNKNNTVTKEYKQNNSPLHVFECILAPTPHPYSAKRSLKISFSGFQPQSNPLTKGFVCVALNSWDALTIVVVRDKQSKFKKPLMCKHCTLLLESTIG